VRIHYNLGRALSESSHQPEAMEHLQLGLLSKSRTLRANSLYNLGNCQYRQQKLDEAIAMYTQALLLDPKDRQAKENLELCWKKKSEQQQKPDSTGKQQPQQKPQDPRQQQSQQQPQQAQAEKGSIGKDQANRMLQAIRNQEKDNLKKRPRPPQQQPAGGKDW